MAGRMRQAGRRTGSRTDAFRRNGEDTCDRRRIGIGHFHHQHDMECRNRLRDARGVVPRIARERRSRHGHRHGDGRSQSGYPQPHRRADDPCRRPDRNRHVHARRERHGLARTKSLPGHTRRGPLLRYSVRRQSRLRPVRSQSADRVPELAFGRAARGGRELVPHRSNGPSQHLVLVPKRPDRHRRQNGRRARHGYRRAAPAERAEMGSPPDRARLYGRCDLIRAPEQHGVPDRNRAAGTGMGFPHRVESRFDRGTALPDRPQRVETASHGARHRPKHEFRFPVARHADDRPVGNRRFLPG